MSCGSPDCSSFIILSFNGCFWRIVLGQVLRAAGRVLCRASTCMASTCMASTVMRHMPPAYCAGALPLFLYMSFYSFSCLFSHHFLRLSRRLFFSIFSFPFLLLFPFLPACPALLLPFHFFSLSPSLYPLLLYTFPSCPAAPFSFPSFSFPFPLISPFLPTACPALT